MLCATAAKYTHYLVPISPPPCHSPTPLHPGASRHPLLGHTASHLPFGAAVASVLRNVIFCNSQNATGVLVLAVLGVNRIGPKVISPTNPLLACLWIFVIHRGLLCRNVTSSHQRLAGGDILCLTISLHVAEDGADAKETHEAFDLCCQHSKSGGGCDSAQPPVRAV